jgi:hypothetical protein
MKMARSIFFQWVMLEIKFVEEIKTHILFSIIFFTRKSYRTCENVEKYDSTGQNKGNNIVWRMRFTCWIPKARDTHSEYVTRIAFPPQHWSRGRGSMIRLYPYVHFLSLWLYTRCRVNSYTYCEHQGIRILTARKEKNRHGNDL